MECFGILRCAQDDSKDLQWQEQSNAEDNSKGKNKKQRQKQKQTRAKTKANAEDLRCAPNDSKTCNGRNRATPRTTAKAKIKNKDKRREQKQKQLRGVLRSAQNDSKKAQPKETHSKKPTTANTDSGSADLRGQGRFPF